MPIPRPPDDTGVVRSRYVKDAGKTALVLNYPKNEAQRMRALIESIRLRGNRKPSLSLIARRSIAVYLDYVHGNSAAMETEVQALEILATPIATRKKSVE